jgi:hypothetical protein
VLPLITIECDVGFRIKVWHEFERVDSCYDRLGG